MSLELLKAQEVAKITRLSVPMVYKLVAQGKLPHYRIERAVRISRDDLENYLATRRQLGARGSRV